MLTRPALRDRIADANACSLAPRSPDAGIVDLHAGRARSGRVTQRSARLARAASSTVARAKLSPEVGVGDGRQVGGAFVDEQLAAGHLCGATEDSGECGANQHGAAAQDSWNPELVDLEERGILRRHVGAERGTFRSESVACAFGELFPTLIAEDPAIERFGGGLGIGGTPHLPGKLPVVLRPPGPRRHHRLPHAERRNSSGARVAASMAIDPPAL